MCRGIALGYNKGKEPHVICEGISSHTKTLGREEDDYLKFEIIIDESKEFHYSVELDESYFFNGILDETVLKRFSNYFNKDKTIKESVVKAVGAWVRKNEVFVLRNLLINSHYGRFKDQDMSYCQSEGSQNMPHCEAGGNQDMSYCKAGSFQNMAYCKAENGQYMPHCEAGGNQDMSYCKAGGVQYIAYMESGDKEANEFLKKLSDLNSNITMSMLIRMAMKCPEDVVSTILKGGKSCAEE